MSFKLSFERLAIYNQWMNNGIYEAAGKLSPTEQNKDRGAYFCSIIGTLNHIMVGDILWFKRFSGHPAGFKSLEYFRTIEKPESLSSIVHVELADLASERQNMDRCILLFTSELTDDETTSTLNYQNSKGKEFNRNFGHLIQHVFNHQTHHRGQATTLLFQAGIDVGVTDMLGLIPEV
jgi:uncharacterized damage-inducible protein DinB